MTQTALFVGIDVSKFRLDVAMRPEPKQFSVGNDEAGLHELMQPLKRLQPRRVLLESTGGFALLAVTLLSAQGLPVVVVNLVRSVTLRATNQPTKSPFPYENAGGEGGIRTRGGLLTLARFPGV
jgi:transposase